MTDEVWLPVVGFEGYYEVSDLGRVRRDARARDWRSRGQTRKPVRQNTGYYYVLLSARGHTRCRTIHSLVMEAFVGPRPHGYETNHKDGNKANCRLDNLEYITISENRKHAFQMGLNGKGEKHWTQRFDVGTKSGRVLTDDQILEMRSAAEHGESQEALARRYGVSRRTVQKWLHGESPRSVSGLTRPWKRYGHPSKEEVQEMLQLVDNGEVKTSVARRFGISRAYLYKLLKGNGLGMAGELDRK